MSAGVSGDNTLFVVNNVAIGEMLGSVDWGGNVWPTKNIRPRGAECPTYLRGQGKEYNPFSATCNFIDNNSTQDETASGVLGLCWSGTTVTFEVRGPNYSDRVRDHYLCSGFFTEFDITEGENENQRELSFTFQRSGVEEYNGTTKGAAT